MSNKKPSLFQLSKVDPLDKTRLVTQEVHTVNFESAGYLDQSVQKYFDSRFRFLKASYDFAKKLKVEGNPDFDASAKTQKLFASYLAENQTASMITGTEFGVITTKVIESIKSISKNKYLKDLQESIKETLFQKAKPEMVKLIEVDKNKSKKDKNDDQAKYKEELKKFEVKIDDLIALSDEDIQTLFKYDLVTQINVWLEISKLLQNNSRLEFLLNTERDNIRNLCEEFLAKYNLLLARISQKTKEFIKPIVFQNTNKLLESFVNQFYFEFDAKIRLLEDIYLGDLNENINKFIQQVGNELLDHLTNNIGENSEIKTLETETKKVAWNLAKMDFGNLKTPENFIIILEYAVDCNWDEIAKKGAKKEDDGSVSEKSWFAYDKLFLRHPKSAPSYPSIKDKIISWDGDNRTSEIINQFKNSFDEVRFMDFWLARCKRIIENSEIYKVFKHVKAVERREGDNLALVDEENLWAEWLELIITQKELPQFEINPDKIHVKQRIVKSRQVDRIIFVHEKSLENDTWKYSENNKINRIEYAKNIGGKGEIKTSRTPQEYLTNWIKKEFENLRYSHVELGILSKNIKILDSNWITSWVDLITSKIGKEEKLAVKTDKRLEKSRNLKALQWSLDQVKELVINELIRLERHLLLDHSHEEFKIFDLVSFKRYQNLSQMFFEAIITDSKIIRYKKGELAKLILKKEVVLPIKIDRMTADKSNGKSTLVYEVDTENENYKIINKSSNILVYPINLAINGGKNIKIVDSLFLAQNEIKSGKFSKLFVGFLNGSKDNDATRRSINVKDAYGNLQTVLDKNGNEKTKGYKVFENWKLKDKLSGVEYKDTLRGSHETVGATNIAGYPKLYYILVPKVCNNLIIPVTSNTYYLTKYTPYHHLSTYLSLEKEVLDLYNKSNNYRNSEIQEKIKEILQLRARLRYYYRISSLEVDLIQELKLDTKSKKIYKCIKAEAHMQFGNPVAVVAEESEETKAKDKYTFEEVTKKFKTLLSVDLGEKIIASMTLSDVDWENYSLTPKVQSFLPLGEKDKTNDQKTEYSNFYKVLNYADFTSENDKLIIDYKTDTTFRNFNGILSEYENQQKQFGVVKNNLAESKKNFTDQVIEKISTQIAKIALKYKSFVVFENLPVGGFGSKKHQLSLYTEVYRHTVKKLQKIGLVINLDVMKFEPSDIRAGIAKVRAHMTSQTCSNCDYVPKYINNDSQLAGVKTNDNWKKNGKITFDYQNGQNTKTIFRIDDKNGDIEVFDRDDKLINQDLQNRFYFYKNQNNTNKETVYLGLTKYLYTKERRDRKINKDTLKFINKYILNPRLTQDSYNCPSCGHNDNADYQASYNIGKKFLKETERKNLENNQ
jgi:hypothetical protein